MSKFFQPPSPVSTRRTWRRAAVFAVGLGLLWLLLQVLPRTSPPSSPAVYSDAAGTVALKPASPERAPERSLFTPGYLAAIGLLACGGLLAWHLRKRSGSTPGSDGQLRLLGQLSLGPNQQLRLVACGDEVLLLGVTASQINLLKTFPAADFAPAPDPARSQPARIAPLRRVAPAPAARRDPSFGEILRSLSPTSSP